MTEAYMEREKRELRHNRYKAEWEAQNTPPPFMPAPHKFQAGKQYILSHWGAEKEGKKKHMYFLRDEGSHHIFVSIAGGWLECFTNVQLMDYEVREFKEGVRT